MLKGCTAVGGVALDQALEAWRSFFNIKGKNNFTFISRGVSFVLGNNVNQYALSVYNNINKNLKELD